MNHAPTIPPEVAGHVLGLFGHDGGTQPGTFHEYLLHAISSADPDNRDRLATAFPAYGAAVAAASYDPDGIANLQRIAGGAA